MERERREREKGRLLLVFILFFADYDGRGKIFFLLLVDYDDTVQFQ